jgi:hypothetical protein
VAMAHDEGYERELGMIAASLEHIRMDLAEIKATVKGTEKDYRDLDRFRFYAKGVWAATNFIILSLIGLLAYFK